MAVTPPRVAVAVSTYQRAGHLPRLVAALEAQRLPPAEFEVVIADNGSTDETATVLAEIAATTPLRLRVVRVERNRGPAAGRNAAWRATTAPIIAFTDDDTQPAPGWLVAGLAAMEGAHRVVVGRTGPRPEEEVVAGRPFTRTVRVNDARWFPTCNAFYRRADLEEVGGFDEGFGTPAGEDTDLGLRVCALGAEPTFLPEAVMYHDVRRPSLRATLRETVRWGGIVRLVRRHPSTRTSHLHHRLFWKASHPRALLLLFGVAMARRWPPAIVLVWPWIRFRTRMVPFCTGPRCRWAVLPAGLGIDLLEVLVMARASARERTLVL